MLDSRSLPYYSLFEMGHSLLSPIRAMADTGRLFFKNPLNPMAHTLYGRTLAASAEMFERGTRRYDKPRFNLTLDRGDDLVVPVAEDVVWEKPFCRLLHFVPQVKEKSRAKKPRLLLVAPMSGHYATLLRGTVERFIKDHDVYITDWVDARLVPLKAGSFDLNDYIDYVIEALHVLGKGTHVIAVCQPSVPVIAAVAVMEARKDPCVPRTMTLMGGPIDTRLSPTAVGDVAQKKGLDWFRRNLIMTVPFPQPGYGRCVYPGFLQLSGFVAMNINRHVNAHRDLFRDLIEGDEDSAVKHKAFYDEYLAVMDMTAEFYLQTVDTVFIKHALPLGIMTHRGEPVDLAKIKRTALLTVEGEKDDITGLNQTKAAHDLCTSLPVRKKQHYLQMGVGHYGVFNGSKFRNVIAPKIEAFIRAHDAPDGKKAKA